jgi:hypothetical protein
VPGDAACLGPAELFCLELTWRRLREDLEIVWFFALKEPDRKFPRLEIRMYTAETR